MISVHDAKFYRAVTLGGSIGAGESYRDGYWSCDDLVALIQIFARNMQASIDLGGGFNSLLDVTRRVAHRLKRNTVAGSRRNIAEHYDLSNDFYSLFLDETMTYSSGVFPQPDSTMREASIEKYERICQKLQLSPGDEVLEIGTGWGGFALHAATNYGCRVTTTTISRQQYNHAQQKVEKHGTENRVTLLLSDYRDLTGQYDKLVSIEMIEAVGHEYFDTYFAKCSSLLKPDGLFALQAITIPDQRYERYQKSVDFIQKYIFPGGCLPSLGAISQSVGNTISAIAKPPFAKSKSAFPRYCCKNPVIAEVQDTRLWDDAMKWLLAGLCIVVLFCMTWITVVASLDRSVWQAGRGLWPDPWFIATLMDAYFGFLTFFVWVAYKERSWTVRSGWFVAIMLLGNFAISGYVLWQLSKQKEFSWEAFLLRAEPTASFASSHCA